MQGTYPIILLCLVSWAIAYCKVCKVCEGALVANGMSAAVGDVPNFKMTNAGGLVNLEGVRATEKWARISCREKPSRFTHARRQAQSVLVGFTNEIDSDRLATKKTR